MFKSQLIKSNHRVLIKNIVDTNRAPVFAPDNSATVLVGKRMANPKEHSIKLVFL